MNFNLEREGELGHAHSKIEYILEKEPAQVDRAQTSFNVKRIRPKPRGISLKEKKNKFGPN